MDAAQKLLKNIAILISAALLLSTVGLAATLVAPSTVAIGATGFNDASVTSSDSTAITFTIGTPVYSGGDPAWLTVTGPSTTPASLRFQASSPPGLTQAVHSATVLLHPTAPTGVADVTITVTFDTTPGGGGGGGSTTLTASNSNVALNSIKTLETVNISTTSASPITIDTPTVSGTVGSITWLTANLSSSTVSSAAPDPLTIRGNPSGLLSGTYRGTVTLTPNTGTPLTIIVTFTVGSGTGGAWSTNPSAISWSFVTNTGIYPSQAVSVNATAGSTSYSVNTTQTGGYRWLLVSANGQLASPQVIGIPVGAAFTLSVGTQANNLTAGTYSDQAIIKDQNGVQQASVTVTLAVNGGGSSGLTISPTSVQFTSAVNGAQQLKVVNVTSSTGGTLIVTGCTTLSWLTCTLPSDALSPNVGVGFIVYANPSGLTDNTYSSTLQLQVGSQSGTVTVTLVVGGGGGGGGTTTTAVAPTSLTFSYQFGTPATFVARQKLVITGTPGPWSSTKFVSNPFGGAWLNFSPSSGSSLPDPAMDATNPAATPTVSVDPTGLAVGSYVASINISTPSGVQVVQVLLNVVSSTVIIPNPAGTLIFTAQSGQPKPGLQALFWTDSDQSLSSVPTTATANNPWISLSGAAPGTVTVQVDQTGLSAGTYSGSISLTQLGAGNSPATVPVLLVVSAASGGGGGGGGGGNTGNVTVPNSSLTFSAQYGSSPADQFIPVSSASGTAPVSFTVQATTNDGVSWLSTNAGASNTTPSTLTVHISSTGLPAGSYTGNINISPNGGTPVNVAVSLTIVPTPTVSAAPTDLTFRYRAGEAAPAAQQINVSGGSALNFIATAFSDGNWLLVSPALGTTPGTVNVTVNPAGLAANVYTGTVIVAGTKGATGSNTITVTLTVTVSLPTVTKLTNAASYATGAISPGEIITLFAGDPSHVIGPADPVGVTLDPTGKVSTSIGGVQVLINGYASPMIYASAAQVSAVVPYEIKLFTTAQVLLKYLGQSSNGLLLNVATSAPGLFTANSSGAGPGAILNSDSTLNSPANPAARGDIVVVYLTGEGETSPPGVTGKVTTLASPPQPLTPAPLLQPSITIGGQPANFTFAGEAPGIVSGVLQVNVTVPTNIAAGEQPIVVNIGGKPSQQGVTVSVK